MISRRLAKEMLQSRSEIQFNRTGPMLGRSEYGVGELRLADRISRLEKVMELQVGSINNIKLNLITFYDKLCQRDLEI